MWKECIWKITENKTIILKYLSTVSVVMYIIHNWKYYWLSKIRSLVAISLTLLNPKSWLWYFLLNMVEMFVTYNFQELWPEFDLILSLSMLYLCHNSYSVKFWWTSTVILNYVIVSRYFIFIVLSPILVCEILPKNNSNFFDLAKWKQYIGPPIYFYASVFKLTE